jgi:hypothetical protein
MGKYVKILALICIIILSGCSWLPTRIVYQDVLIPVGACPVPVIPSKPVLPPMTVVSPANENGISCITEKQYNEISEVVIELMSYSEQCITKLKVYSDGATEANKLKTK